jgi:hypothetical protein
VATIEVPLNTILLIRKDKEICVVKFLEFWNGKTEEDLFGKCAIYYQNNGSGDFSRNNVKYSLENLFYPKPRGFHPFVFQLGRKDLKCGSMSLAYTGKGGISFLAPGQRQVYDNGYEFAPSPWTDISEVNISDSRIRWYKLDTMRKGIIIPVNKLFDESK